MSRVFGSHRVHPPKQVAGGIAPDTFSIGDIHVSNDMKVLRASSEGRAKKVELLGGERRPRPAASTSTLRNQRVRKLDICLAMQDGTHDLTPVSMVKYVQGMRSRAQDFLYERRL